MYREGDQVNETAEEARDGVNVRGMVTVLVASIVLIVLVLAAIWLFSHQKPRSAELDREHAGRPVRTAIV